MVFFFLITFPSLLNGAEVDYLVLPNREDDHLGDLQLDQGGQPFALRGKHVQHVRAMAVRLGVKNHELDE